VNVFEINLSKLIWRITALFCCGILCFRFTNNYNGYNDYKRKKMKAPQLDSASLKTHVTSLQTLLEQTFVSLWGDYGKDLEQLAVSMSEYAQFLDLSSKAQQVRQSLPHPVRQLAENVQVLHFKGGPKQTMYSLIEDLVNTKDFYEPIIFDECQHAVSPFKNRTERQRFLDGFNAVGVAVDQIRYVLI